MKKQIEKYDLVIELILGLGIVTSAIGFIEIVINGSI